MMPNGDDYSAEEWGLIQEVLRPLDPLLEAFRQSVGGSLVRNYHGSPGRFVSWGSDRWRVDVFLSDTKRRLLGVVAMAWLGKGDDKRLKSETVERDLSGDELLGALPDLLEKARSLAERWTEEDLEWDSLQQRLRPLVPHIEAFARAVRGRVELNYHGTAGWSVHWTGHRWVRRTDRRWLRWPGVLDRSVLIRFRRGGTFSVVAAASIDKRSRRYAKCETLAEGLSADDLERQLPELLEQARSLAESWTVEDLE